MVGREADCDGGSGWWGLGVGGGIRESTCFQRGFLRCREVTFEGIYLGEGVQAACSVSVHPSRIF